MSKLFKRVLSRYGSKISKGKSEKGPENPPSIIVKKIKKNNNDGQNSLADTETINRTNESQ